ncbi:MAG: hypothetical protein IJY90_02495 [Clostridia bacterium]|nr:hypothetical protein [Clostridia bacterium]
MLDIKSKLVLKILQKECPNGSYSLVEARDVISAMPIKYRVDNDGLENILIYLERQEYISIKYDDENVYCLCVLPFGNEIIETDGKQKNEGKSPRLWMIFILCFLSAFLGCFVSNLIQNLIV